MHSEPGMQTRPIRTDPRVGASAPRQAHGKPNDRPWRYETVGGHHDAQEMVRSRLDFLFHRSPFIGNDARVRSLAARGLSHPGCCPEGIARSCHEVDGYVAVTNGVSPSLEFCPTIGDTASGCQPTRARYVDEAAQDLTRKAPWLYTGVLGIEPKKETEDGE